MQYYSEDWDKIMMIEHDGDKKLGKALRYSMSRFGALPSNFAEALKEYHDAQSLGLLMTGE